MSDRPDAPSPGHDTPEDAETPEIAEVRRLLADARHVEPMPDDVAARMGRVLDRLGDESPAARPETSGARVIAIAPDRRRRAVWLLGAAAAIVVGGVVIQNVQLPSGGDSAATSAEPATNASLGKAQDQAPEDAKEPSRTTSSGDLVAALPVKIHPRRFTDDVRQARRSLGKSAYVAEQDRAKAAECTDLPSGARALPATYQRADAALVFRRPQGGSQIVELFVCGQSSPIRTTTLSVP